MTFVRLSGSSALDGLNEKVGVIGNGLRIAILGTGWSSGRPST